MRGSPGTSPSSLRQLQGRLLLPPQKGQDQVNVMAGLIAPWRAASGRALLWLKMAPQHYVCEVARAYRYEGQQSKSQLYRPGYSRY